MGKLGKFSLAKHPSAWLLIPNLIWTIWTSQVLKTGLDILWEQPHLGYLGLFDSSWNLKLQRERQKQKIIGGKRWTSSNLRERVWLNLEQRLGIMSNFYFIWLHSSILKNFFKKKKFNLPNERSLIFFSSFGWAII